MNRNEHFVSPLYRVENRSFPFHQSEWEKSLNFQTKYYSFNTTPRNAMNYAASTSASPSIPKNQRMPYIALNPEDT
jgi:hypothetical protein